MNRHLLLALVLVLLPGVSLAEFEKPVTFLQEKVQKGKRISRSGEMPQADFLAYWRLRSQRRGEKDLWLKLSPVQGGKALAFHVGSSPRFFEKIQPYDQHFRGEDFAGVLGQFKGGRHPSQGWNILMQGLFQIVERIEQGEKGDCPEHFWWMPTQIVFPSEEKAGLEFLGSVDGKNIEKDGATGKCGLGSKDEIKLELVRHKGVRFVPAFAGRYIHTLTVTAPAQFGAEVEIAWDYTTLRGPSGGIGGVKIRLGKGSAAAARDLSSSDDVSGTYRYTFQNRGLHRIEVDVLDKDKKKLFSDNLVLDIN